MLSAAIYFKQESRRKEGRNRGRDGGRKDWGKERKRKHKEGQKWQPRSQVQRKHKPTPQGLLGHLQRPSSTNTYRNGHPQAKS